MRDILPVLLVSLVLVHAVPAFAGAPGPICGDVNDSGGVNTSDALLVLQNAVQLPVTLDCSGFTEQTEECQEEREACAGNLAQCLGGLRCGDGVVNSVGEHCDDEDLGGSDCASLGFGPGTLACDDSCKFDTSGCSACHLFNGKCMILGIPPDEGDASCDAACASIGLDCDEAALDAINTSDESCRNAIDAADPFAAPHPISSLSPATNMPCGEASDYAVGCTYSTQGAEDAIGALRFLYVGSPVLCSADFLGGTCGSLARRACVCQP